MSNVMIKMKTLFITVVALLILSTSAFAADAIKAASPVQRPISSENGRFVLGQLSDVRADRFLLDTQTGRIWQLVTYTPTDKEGKNIGSPRQVLQTVVFIDNLDRKSAMPISDVTPDDVTTFNRDPNKVK